MTIEERINIRDFLINRLKELKGISFTTKNWYRIISIDLFKNVINNNKDILEKYNLYIKEFRSEEEAIYCLLHITDISEHICPMCNTNPIIFYDKKHGYRNTCGSKECNTKAHMNNKSSNITVKKVKEIVTIIKEDNIVNKDNNINVVRESKPYYFYKYSINSIESNSEFDGINKSIITNYDMWVDDNSIKEFVINKYKEKNSLLLLKNISYLFNVNNTTLKKRLKELNLLQFFYIDNDYNIKDTFKEFLKDNNINSNNVKSISDEIDFLLDSYYLGFEINDIATYNSINNGSYTFKDKNYHLRKLNTMLKNNIRLIHIWEWEIRDKNYWNNKLSKWILDLLNRNKTKIDIHECIIKDVSIDEEKMLLNSCHLQGYIKSNKCLGIYYNDELIQLMSFGEPRYNKNYEYELLRLCTKYGYEVNNGSRKLLESFIKNNSKSIISYCNLDKFTGEVYRKLGFKLLNKTEPTVIWCNKDMQHFTQTSLTMKGADKLIGTNYGKGTDNEEIVLDHGFVPIYNCGLEVYILK